MSSGFVRIEIKEVKVFEKLCGKDSTELWETKKSVGKRKCTYFSYTSIFFFPFLSLPLSLFIDFSGKKFKVVISLSD